MLIKMNLVIEGTLLGGAYSLYILLGVSGGCCLLGVCEGVTFGFAVGIPMYSPRRSALFLCT